MQLKVQLKKKSINHFPPFHWNFSCVSIQQKCILCERPLTVLSASNGLVEVDQFILIFFHIFFGHFVVLFLQCPSTSIAYLRHFCVMFLETPAFYSQHCVVLCIAIFKCKNVLQFVLHMSPEKQIGIGLVKDLKG